VGKAPLEDIASMALYAQVVQLRSFTAAGEAVGLAKSAVSKRISLLEERLGVRLLTRTTRKLTLTEEGVRYYEHCAALLASANAAEDAVAGASTTPRGPLKVNAPVTFAQMFLADAVAMFLGMYPDIEILLSTEDTIVDVVDGGYDVVVRITRPKGDSSLISRKLSADRLVVCGSSSYLDAKGRPETPGDLIGHNCMHYSIIDRAAEWRFRGAMGPMTVSATGNLATTDGTVLRRAALAGLGLAVLPYFMVAQDVNDNALELVLEGSRKAEILISALFVSRRQLPARTKLFLDFLASYFSRSGWRARARSPLA
jgi:DNA-binding transcriptional LysR family regulator